MYGLWGTGYNLPANGLDESGAAGNLYGLAWSYNPNYSYAGSNPQAKAGLSHQLLLMMNGVTKTALGNGIWTSGNLTVLGSGSFGQPITVGAPTAASHATTKSYVDSAISGAGDNLGNHIATTDINVNKKEMLNMRIENRTSDPSSPAVGQIWIRTDL